MVGQITRVIGAEQNGLPGYLERLFNPPLLLASSRQVVIRRGIFRVDRYGALVYADCLVQSVQVIQS